MITNPRHKTHISQWRNGSINDLQLSDTLSCNRVHLEYTSEMLRRMIRSLIWHPLLLCQFSSINPFQNPFGLMLSTYIIITCGIFICYIQYHTHTCYFLFHFHLPTVLFLLPLLLPLTFSIQILFQSE